MNWDNMNQVKAMTFQFMLELFQQENLSLVVPGRGNNV